MPATYLGQHCGICEHLLPTHNLSQALNAGLPEKMGWVQLHRQTGDFWDAMYDVTTQFLPQFLTFKMAEGSVSREDVATLRTKYDTGRDLFALKHWPQLALSSSSHLLQLLSSNISDYKDKSNQQLALQQDDSFHITNETVENCANSICVSRRFEYSDDSSQMRRWPTEQVADHCQLQTATKSHVGRRHMRTRL